MKSVHYSRFFTKDQPSPLSAIKKKEFPVMQANTLRRRSDYDTLWRLVKLHRGPDCKLNIVSSKSGCTLLLQSNTKLSNKHNFQFHSIFSNNFKQESSNAMSTLCLVKCLHNITISMILFFLTNFSRFISGNLVLANQLYS